MKNISNNISMNSKTDKKLQNDIDILSKNNGLNKSVSNKPSRRFIKAMKEADDILSGKIKAKGYNNVNEFINDMLN